MKIKMINNNREKYLKLMLLADPDENVVREYMDKGDLFVLSKDEDDLSLILLIPVNNNTIEIKNLATLENHQKNGYAKNLIYHVINHYKSDYNNIIIGTANSSIINLKFYKSLGFTEFKRIDDFFIDNYDKPIYEDDIQAVDLIYLKKII